MSQTTKLVNVPKGAIKYNSSMLREMMTQYDIKRYPLMSIFGHTNPTTVNNWKDGSEIYVGALLAICNAFKLNPLRFIKYSEHTFTSSIVDLYRLEICGLTVGDILRERGIEAYDEKPGTHTLRTAEDIEAEISELDNIKQRVQDQYEAYQIREKSRRITQLSTADMIDKITEIQQKAFAHEQEALDELRKQKDMEIAARDQTIINLKLTLARMGYQGMIADENVAGAVADDATISEQ